MDPNKQQIVERLKQATNILVTVSANPSIDQLASCIGMTLFLNKLGKHATAVFSGDAPSTIEFLQPEATLEKDTNSLRDFIIALDKSKADKLRYKVEENIVKIFITPYRTSLSQDDLNFSQGDFNVEAVLALGVTEKEDLDTAIVAHGRILHDATVMVMNTGPSGGLGSINWSEPSSSSLCEMVTSFLDSLKKDQLDNQIATALLTGIVAETNRFSNERTSPQTMSEAAKLMAAGANQQLIATKLQEPTPVPPASGDEASPADDASGQNEVSDDGTLSINHYQEEHEVAETDQDKPLDYSIHDDPQDDESDLPSVHIDDTGNYKELNENKPGEAPEGGSGLNENEILTERTPMILDRPVLGGTLTASADRGLDGEESGDPLSSPAQLESILQHGANNTAMQYEPILPPVAESTDQSPPSLTSVLPSSAEDGDATPPSEPTFANPSEDLPPVAQDDTLADLESKAAQTEEGTLPPTSQEPEPLLQPFEAAPDEPAPPARDVDNARDAVQNALQNDTTLEPVQGLGTSPLSSGPLNQEPTPIGDILAQSSQQPSDEPVGEVIDPTEAPTVPPPLLPPLPPIQPDNLAPPTNPLFNQPQ